MNGSRRYEFADVAMPILIYFLAAQLINVIGTGWMHIRDAAALTSTTAVLTLPLFLWMYRRDRAVQGTRHSDAAAAPGASRAGAAVSPGTRRAGLLSRTRRPGWRDYLLLIAAGLLCNLILTVLVNLLLDAVPAQISNETQERLFAGGLPFQVIGLGMLVPAAEEVLFRGLVYGRLKRYTKQYMESAWPAVLGSAAIFALIHGNLIQILFAFPMGVILAVIIERYGTVTAPAVFHMAVNVSSVLAEIIL